MEVKSPWPFFAWYLFLLIDLAFVEFLIGRRGIRLCWMMGEAAYQEATEWVPCRESKRDRCLLRLAKTHNPYLIRENNRVSMLRKRKKGNGRSYSFAFEVVVWSWVCLGWICLFVFFSISSHPSDPLHLSPARYGRASANTFFDNLNRIGRKWQAN